MCLPILTSLWVSVVELEDERDANAASFQHDGRLEHLEPEARLVVRVAVHRASKNRTKG